MPEIGPYSLSGGRRLARKCASSDPTDTLNPLACRSLNSMPSHQQLEKLYAKQKGKTPAAKPRASGLDLEQQISTPVEAELFS